MAPAWQWFSFTMSQMMYVFIALVLTQLLLAAEGMAKEIEPLSQPVARHFSGISQDPALSEFMNQHRLLDFNSIQDPEMKMMALAHLISLPDTPEINDNIPDRSAISMAYENYSAEQKAHIQAMAFEFAVDNADTESAMQSLEAAAGSNARLAQQYICNAMFTIGNDLSRYDYTFSEHSFKEGTGHDMLNKMDSLIPIMVRVPGIDTKICQVKSGNQMMAISIPDLVMKARAEVAQKFFKALHDSKLASQALFRRHSSCTDQDLKALTDNAIVAANQQPVGTPVLFMDRIRDCVINAKIMRTEVKNNYDYAPSDGISGYQKKSIPFTGIVDPKTGLRDIVKLLKARPQSFVLSQAPAPRPMDLSTEPTPSPQLSTTPPPAPQEKPITRSDIISSIRDMVHSLTSGK